MNDLNKQLKYIKTCPHYKLFAIDLFCGAGGETTGIELATIDGKKCAKVIACVNHDPNAIASHAANHKSVLHYIEDIRTLNLGGLEQLTQTVRLFHPDSYLLLHASLECTNFSKAKGGQPRDADSRTLAEHLFRYIEAIKPDYIQIENVEEFMCWGDLDENGKPVSKDKGCCYIRWVNNVKHYGYDFDYRLLNAANYGAYTSRKRFFGLFARNGLPIVFPCQTYAKFGDEGGLFNQYKKWKAVRDVLDLQDEGESIFGRKKSLCEKTLERIYAGLVKFVAGGKTDFLARYNTVRPQDTVKSLDEPCGVLTCDNRFAKVKVHFLSKQFGGDPSGKNIDLEQPAGSITCKDHHALVSSKFITEYYGGSNHNHSIEEPATTVTTMARHAFVSAFYGRGFNSSIDGPAPTVTTKDRFGLIKSQFLANEYSGGGQLSDVETPSPAILTTPKQKLVTAKRWLANSNFNDVGSSLDSPAPVVTANHKYHYLMNPQFASVGGSIDNPCFTLIARMDKMPPYLVSTEAGEIGIAIYDTDSPMTVKIKEFMVAFGIIDIKMRMLNIKELKRIMGFPESYILIGTQAEQKKYIGNAVEVNMSIALCQALCQRLIDLKIA